MLYGHANEPVKRQKLWKYRFCLGVLKMERVTGIEPAWPVWKTGTLPLSYTRILTAKDITVLPFVVKCCRVGCGRRNVAYFVLRARGGTAEDAKNRN
jgi:hypothetical protein